MNHQTWILHFIAFAVSILSAVFIILTGQMKFASIYVVGAGFLVFSISYFMRKFVLVIRQTREDAADGLEGVREKNPFEIKMERSIWPSFIIALVLVGAALWMALKMNLSMSDAIKVQNPAVYQFSIIFWRGIVFSAMVSTIFIINGSIGSVRDIIAVETQPITQQSAFLALTSQPNLLEMEKN
jgi:hypothetical protein